MPGRGDSVCTLSWLPRPAGFFLCFNRDERRTRAPALPPTVQRLDGVRVIAPTDGDFGGTWIGVNQFGVAVALLNRYEHRPIDPPGGPVSRGLLVRGLLSSGSVAELRRRVAEADLGRYQPFTLCAAAPDDALALFDWTGDTLTAHSHRRPGLVRTSSGGDQAEAERLRTDAWVRCHAREPLSPGSIERFHRSHDPERGPFSVCMHREEAETQSLVKVRVSRAQAVLEYLAGPPCQRPPNVSLRLDRTPSPAKDAAPQ